MSVLDSKMEDIPAYDLILANPAEIEALGLKLVYGLATGGSRRLRSERFRGHYGISPAAYSAIFTDLQKVTPGFLPNLEKLLMAGRFLFLYESRVVLAGATGLNEGTVAKWTWEYVHLLQGLKEYKVSTD